MKSSTTKAESYLDTIYLKQHFIYKGMFKHFVIFVNIDDEYS